MTLARKFIAEAVATRPAILLVFDVLELAGDELAALPLSERRRVLERLLPIPDAMVIEADEYLFTLGGAVAEVAVLDEPLCYYRLHSQNLYQFVDYDPVGASSGMTQILEQRK